MSQASPASDSRSNIFFMLVSAAVFGYFGFGMSWVHQYTNTTPPVWIPMIAVLMWTLRCGTIAFVASAIISMGKPWIGSLLYAAAGLATAAVFAVVAVWEWTNAQGYFSGVPPFLLILFALWNGYGSWMGIKELMAAKRSSPAHEQPFGAAGR
jgi:hypothetical protein